MTKMIAYFQKDGVDTLATCSMFGRSTLELCENSPYRRSEPVPVLPLDESVKKYFQMKGVPFEKNANDELHQATVKDYKDLFEEFGPDMGFVLSDFVSNSIRNGYQLKITVQTLPLPF